MAEILAGRYDIANPLLEFLNIGKAPFCRARPDQPIAGVHLEYTTRTGGQCHLAKLGFKGGEQFLAHPRGTQHPTALRAVSDQDSGFVKWHRLT